MTDKSNSYNSNNEKSNNNNQTSWSNDNNTGGWGIQKEESNTDSGW